MRAADPRAATAARRLKDGALRVQYTFSVSLAARSATVSRWCQDIINRFTFQVLFIRFIEIEEEQGIVEGRTGRKQQNVTTFCKASYVNRGICFHGETTALKR